MFASHAGLCVVDGAPIDASGNARGNEYDLVADGAFDGQRIVVLNVCPGAPVNDCCPPVVAMREKGFHVDVMTRLPDSAEEVQGILTTANQLWVISSPNTALSLSAAQMDVIVDNWRDGLSCYIFGDNRPYYTDANALLERMFPKMGLEMEGYVAMVQGCSQYLRQRLTLQVLCKHVYAGTILEGKWLRRCRRREPRASSHMY